MDLIQAITNTYSIVNSEIGYEITNTYRAGGNYDDRLLIDLKPLLRMLSIRITAEDTAIITDVPSDVFFFLKDTSHVVERVHSAVFKEIFSLYMQSRSVH